MSAGNQIKKDLLNVWIVKLSLENEYNVYNFSVYDKNRVQSIVEYRTEANIFIHVCYR